MRKQKATLEGVCVKIGNNVFSFICHAKHVKIHAEFSVLKYIFSTAIKDNYYIENVKGIANTLSNSDFKCLY